MTDPTDDPAAVLAAFREVTGWSDAEVLHYFNCDSCVPICGHEEYACKRSPQRKPPESGITRSVWVNGEYIGQDPSDGNTI